MQVQLAALADSANVSREGKLNILGEFNTLFGLAAPVTWPLMYFVAKMSATNAEGPDHQLQLRILDEDGNLAAPLVDIVAKFGASSHAGVPFSAILILPVQNPIFHRFGEYTFELRAGTESICSLPLYVTEAKQPPAVA